MKIRNRKTRAKQYVTNCQPGQLRDVSGRCGPGIGVDIPRDNMPQIKKEDLDSFIAYAQVQGNDITRTTIKANDLSPTQSEFRQERVDAMPSEAMKQPVLVSDDDYVLDGTHRWIKHWQSSKDAQVPVIKIGLPLHDALDLMRGYPKTVYATNALVVNISIARGSKLTSRYDPTRTSLLRKSMDRKINAQFARLKGEIVSLLVNEDVLGLVKNVFCPTGSGGGIDPSCDKGLGKLDLVSRAKKLADSSRARESRANTVIPPSINIPEVLYISMPGFVAEKALIHGHSGEKKGLLGHGENRSDSVYIATSKEITDHYAAMYEGSRVLAIKSADLDRSKMYYDAFEPPSTSTSGPFNDSNPGYIAYRGKIPAHSFIVNYNPTEKRDAFGRWSSEGKAIEQFGKDVVGDSAEVIKSLGDAGKWLMGQTKKMYKKLETRYGKKTAVGIFAAGQATSWGAFGVGIAVGLPLYIPSAVATAPFAAIAEVHKRVKDKLHSLVGNELTQDRINELGKKLVTAVSNLIPEMIKRYPECLKPTSNTRWKFSTSSEQVTAFQSWLRTQVERHITGKNEEQLWRSYIQWGFRKGASRSFDDMQGKQRFLDTSQEKIDGYNGNREEFLKTSFNHPENIDKVKLLVGRTFTELKNVTEDMSTKIGRTLADGLVQGQNPRQIAREMAKVVDISKQRALLISQTELIRAHAEGQLSSLESLGAEELAVMVEWNTTGDGRVCPECSSMSGATFDINKARGLIPAHPRCRCAWIPSGPSLSLPTLRKNRLTKNIFCPTGLGGGIDPSCSSGHTSESTLNHLTSLSNGTMSESHISTMKSVLEKMPQKALNEIVSNVKGVAAYNSVQDVSKGLTDEIWKEANKDKSKWMSWLEKITGIGELNKSNFRLESASRNASMIASYFQPTSRLHINGGTKKSPADEVYAHELGHAIDHNGKYSNTREWKDAWSTEINKPHTPLSKYAKVNESEGFAELSRALYSNNQLMHYVNQELPRSAKFFKDHGLWPS